MGGGKGRQRFIRSGKKRRSDAFRRALMTELYRHFRPDTDVPAGDIGGRARSGLLWREMMRKLSNNSSRVFTGKGFPLRRQPDSPGATGYGPSTFYRSDA